MIISENSYELAEFIRDICPNLYTPTKKDCSNLFSEIDGSFEIILNYFHSDFKHIKDSEWIVIEGFFVSVIDKDMWINEQLFKLIDKKFPILRCAIIRMDENSIYNWHTDADRGVCINMLLTCDHFSECLFYDEGNIIVLDYQPNKAYLFNNQKFHKIKNFEKTRYLFSLQFVDDKNKLNYDTVYNWMNVNDLIKK
jgi:hypothetical protein